MATLDDKLMGEKLHYYCSSSEDEDEAQAPTFTPESQLPSRRPNAPQTGPKGVIEDWRRYKQLERENRAEQDAEKIALAKKLSMTCRTDKEDQQAKLEEEKLDQELEDLLDDDYLKEFCERRMREMMDLNAKRKNFGQIIDLDDGNQFLDAIDKEDTNVVIIIFIFEHEIQGCRAMYECLKIIAKDHPYAKICSILASAAGLSKHFKSSGVPALLVYKSGDLTTSFVKITDTLGDDFYATDVEDLLTKHGVLTDKDLTPAIIRGPAVTGNDSDSD